MFLDLSSQKIIENPVEVVVETRKGSVILTIDLGSAKFVPHLPLMEPNIESFEGKKIKVRRLDPSVSDEFDEAIESGDAVALHPLFFGGYKNKEVKE